MAPIPKALHPTHAAFQSQVVTHARFAGWEPWHDNATNARRKCPRCGSILHQPRNAPGFPDLLLVRERVLYRELKVKGDRLDPAQREWRDRLQAAGADWGLWTPDDWELIEETLK